MAEAFYAELVQGHLTVVEWRGKGPKPVLENSWFPILHLPGMVPWVRNGGNPTEHPVAKAVANQDLRVIHHYSDVPSAFVGFNACIDNITQHHLVSVDFVRQETRTAFAEACMIHRYGGRVIATGGVKPIYNIPNGVRMFSKYDGAIRSCVHEMMGLHDIGRNCATFKFDCKAPLLVLSTNPEEADILRSSVSIMRIDSIRSAIRSTVPPLRFNDTWTFYPSAIETWPMMDTDENQSCPVEE